jgi:threonine/homoserine/homoserine lactone efflux protein
MGAVFFLGGEVLWWMEWTMWTAEADYPGEAEKSARQPRVFFLVLFLCRYKEKVQ